MVDLPGERSLVQPLDVALREHLDGAADVDLDEPADASAHLRARVLVRGDGRGDGNHAIAGEQLRDETDAPDVDVAILFAEPEAGAERLTNLIAVEHLDAQAARTQLCGNPLPDRRLAGTGQTGEPDRETAHPTIGAATA